MTALAHFRVPPRTGLGRHVSITTVVAFMLVAYAALYLSWLLLGWGGDDLQLALADGIFVPLGVMVVAIALLVVARTPVGRARYAWLLVAGSFVAYLAGDVLWFLMEVVQGAEVPFPSLADVAYLAYYPLLLAGLLLFPRVRPMRRLKSALDLAIVLVGVTAVLWYLVFGPVWGGAASDPVELLVGLAYPVGDLLVIFALASAFLGELKGISRGALAALGAGVACNAVADLGWVRLSLDESYVSGTWIDIVYMVGWLSMGVAGLIQLRAFGRAGTLTPPPPARLIPGLPYVAIATVYALLAVSAAEAASDLRVLVAGAIGVTALVVARQVIATRENSVLLAETISMRSAARFRAMIQNASDVIALVDELGTISYVTPSVTSVLGLATDEPCGASLASLVQPDDAPLVEELLRTAVGRAGTSGPVACRSAAVETRHLELSISNLLRDPLVGGLVVTIRDVTERRTFEDQLRSQALHDPLTGLANRVLFSDRVEQALHRARRRRVRPAVLYLDLDDFKAVNDTLGHLTGDRVLIEVAQRLLANLRHEDTAARLGGDEFAILIEDSHDVEDATTVADRVRAALALPFEVDGTLLTVGASIGIVRSDCRADSSVALLRDADIAMYVAKREVRGDYRVFEPAMHEATVERVVLEADLRAALDGGQLEVVYQPLIRLHDDLLVGIEALLRWHHPTRGLIMPTVFIPIAESCGEIRRIGLWVIEQACRTVQTWDGHEGGPLRANVNVSVRQLEPPFVGGVREILQRLRFPPEQLVLEITESVFSDDRPAVIEVLVELRALGVRISVDDFGTGYSALSRLSELPVDELKVDRAFVNQMAEGDHGLVSTILQLARDLSLDTVAEGIETVAQQDALRELGCDVGQGYLLGRPASVTTVGTDLLDSHAATELARIA